MHDQFSTLPFSLPPPPLTTHSPFQPPPQPVCTILGTLLLGPKIKKELAGEGVTPAAPKVGYQTIKGEVEIKEMKVNV